MEEVCLCATRVSQWDVEVLLLAFQHCAFHLRGEDSERLKGILSRIEEKSRVAAGGTVPVRLEVRSRRRFDPVVDL